jgi:hypothetical protein
MIFSYGIFIITFLKAKGIYILDTWEGNKLKFSHCALSFTDWLSITYENSIVVFFGFLTYNLNIL